jgi:hypothetical protein
MITYKIKPFPEFIITTFLIIICLSIQLFLIKSTYLNVKLENIRWYSYSEEHFDIGESLYQTGQMTKNDHFNTERPPGYPIYVAGVLHSRDFILDHFTNNYGKTFFGAVLTEMMQDDQLAVALSQLLLGFIAGVLFYLIIRKHTPLWLSYLLLTVFLININTLALIFKIDYSLMEVCIILWLTFIFQNYINCKKTWLLILMGLSIGIACMIRPVYLLFPVFFLVFTFFQENRKVKIVIQKTGLLVLVIFLAFIPLIIRNYRVAHKFLLISEQGGVELYHNSVVSFWQQPKYIIFGNVWGDYGWPLMSKKLNMPEYDENIWYTDTAHVEEIYMQAAIKNLISQPQVYIGNFFYNIYQIAGYDLEFWGYRFINNKPKYQAGYNSFQLYITLLKYFGSGCILFLLIKRKKNRNDIAAIFMTVLILLSYSLVYFYTRYSYIKIPLYFFGIAYFLTYLWNLKYKNMLPKLGTILLACILTVSAFLPLIYFYRYLFIQ